MTGDIQDNDHIRFVFNHPALNKSINLLLMMCKGDVDAECIMSEIEHVIQSNEGFDIDDLFTMDTIKVHLPEGTNLMNRSVPLPKLLQGKKSIVTNKYNDNMCMARALVIAIAKVDDDPRWETEDVGETNCSSKWQGNSVSRLE